MSQEATIYPARAHGLQSEGITVGVAYLGSPEINDFDYDFSDRPIGVLSADGVFYAEVALLTFDLSPFAGITALELEVWCSSLGAAYASEEDAIQFYYYPWVGNEEENWPTPAVLAQLTKAASDLEYADTIVGGRSSVPLSGYWGALDEDMQLRLLVVQRRQVEQGAVALDASHRFFVTTPPDDEHFHLVVTYNGDGTTFYPQRAATISGNEGANVALTYAQVLAGSGTHLVSEGHLIPLNSFTAPGYFYVREGFLEFDLSGIAQDWTTVHLFVIAANGSFGSDGPHELEFRRAGPLTWPLTEADFVPSSEFNDIDHPLYARMLVEEYAGLHEQGVHAPNVGTTLADDITNLVGTKLSVLVNMRALWDQVEPTSDNFLFSLADEPYLVEPTILLLFGAIPRAVSGTQPAAEGQLSNIKPNIPLSGVQPPATGTVAEKYLAKRISGAQPAATGTVTPEGVLLHSRQSLPLGRAAARGPLRPASGSIRTRRDGT